MRKNNRGLYVCIEGLDGSGKTTLVETLKKMFIDKNVEEMFLTNIEYENGNWIINDVQKFNLE